MTGPSGAARNADRPLRIVLVEFLPSGGMFQFSFQFGAALAAQGHRVTLITGPDPELTSSTPGFEVSSLLPTWHPNADSLTGVRRKLRRGVRAGLLLESWRRIAAYLRRERPDVAQFGELRFALDTAAFLAVTRVAQRTAYVDVAHNPLPYDVTGKDQGVEKGGRLTLGLLNRAYRACDLVLVLADGPKQQLLSRFPEAGRVAVCGHGDYSSVYTAQAEDIPAPSAAPPAALMFGAWTKYKNIPLLLDAFALVRERLPGARLTIAGPVMPDVDLAEVERRSAAVGGVDLRPGYVAMEDVPALFGAHRVVMFTYETVNVSGSVHMAYTFGRPVVATRVGAMADVVTDSVTGQLVEPAPGPVSEAMLQLLDPATADRMGAAAREHAERTSSWATVADKAVAAYRDAVGELARPGALRAPFASPGSP